LHGAFKKKRDCSLNNKKSIVHRLVEKEGRKKKQREGKMAKNDISRDAWQLGKEG